MDFHDSLTDALHQAAREQRAAWAALQARAAHAAALLGEEPHRWLDELQPTPADAKRITLPAPAE